MTDLNDLLGVLAVCAYLAGLGAVTGRVLILRARQTPPEQRHGLAYLLAALTVIYLLFVLADAPGVLTILSNRVDDIPPGSTGRTAVAAGIMWVLHALLLRLARGRLR